jgi:hypothetical protein
VKVEGVLAYGKIEIDMFEARNVMENRERVRDIYIYFYSASLYFPARKKMNQGITIHLYIRNNKK